MIQRIFLLIFWLSCFDVSGQVPGKKVISEQFDTVQIKRNILDFTRLVFRKSQSSIDSIVAFCSFPFYSKDWLEKRVYNSATELKDDLNEIFKEEKYKPVEYTTKTLFKSALCEGAPFKSNQYICFKMTTYITNVGERNYSALLRTTFYIENKLPFRIIGVEQAY